MKYIDLGIINGRRKAKYTCKACKKEFVCRTETIKNHKSGMCHKCATSAATKTHGLGGTDIYCHFKNMIRRCYSTKDTTYPYYGGRGIQVCEEWRDNPVAFTEWSMANGWVKGLSLDRININGNYSPKNCRWTDMSTQSANQRKRCDNLSGYTGIEYNKRDNRFTVRVSFNGKSLQKRGFNSIREAVIFRNRYIKEMGWPHPIQEF